MNFKTTILSLVFLMGIGLLIYSSRQDVKQTKIPEIQVTELEQALESNSHFVAVDFKFLYHQKHLPKAFLDLHQVKVIYQEDALKAVVPPQAIPFKTYPTGKHDLEIEVFSAPTKEHKIVVLQMNLIHRQSGNKIFELSRNYEVPN